MRKKRYLFVPALLICVFVLSSVQCNLLVRYAPMLLQGAVALAVRGEATMISKSGTRIRLTKDMKFSAQGFVLPGSRLLTGPNSSVDLIFTDSIKMRIGQNSSVTLDLARLLESENFTRIKMQLNKGIVYAASSRLAKNSELFIATLRSAIKVRGTEFLVEETGTQNRVLVSRGSVEVKGGSLESPVLLEKGISAESSLSGDFNLTAMSSEQKNLMKNMSSDIASLSSSDKNAVKSILETHQENQRLIRESYKEHKALITSGVKDQKEKNSMMLKEQRSNNAADMNNVRSSAAEDLRRLKERVKKQDQP